VTTAGEPGDLGRMIPRHELSGRIVLGVGLIVLLV